jgi:hypothetical protein
MRAVYVARIGKYEVDTKCRQVNRTAEMTLEANVTEMENEDMDWTGI